MKIIQKLGLGMLVLSLAGCAAVVTTPTQDNLQVKLRRFEVVTQSFDSIEADIIIEAKNLSTAVFRADSGSLQVTVEGRSVVDDTGTHVDESDLDAQFSGQIFDGTLGGATEIPPQQKTNLRFPVTLKLPDDPTALEHVISWEKVLLAVKGEAKINGQTFTFGGNRELGLPVFPEISLLNPQVATVDGGSSGVAFFQIVVKNQNNFEMAVDSFDWGLTLEGKEMRALGQGGPEQVPPNSDLQLDDEIPLTQKSFGPNVRSMLRKHHIGYVVKGFWEINGVHRDFTFDDAIEFAR